MKFEAGDKVMFVGKASNHYNPDGLRSAIRRCNNVFTVDRKTMSPYGNYINLCEAHDWDFEEDELELIKKHSTAFDIKKEGKEMDLLKIYIARKVKEIKEEYKAKRLEITKDDEIAKKVQTLRTELNNQYNGKYIDINIVASDYTVDTKVQLKLIDEAENAAIKEFDERMAEVEAQIEICETYEQRIDILTSYNIIDKKTKQLTA